MAARRTLILRMSAQSMLMLHAPALLSGFDLKKATTKGGILDFSVKPLEQSFAPYGSLRGAKDDIADSIDLDVTPNPHFLPETLSRL